MRPAMLEQDFFTRFLNLSLTLNPLNRASKIKMKITIRRGAP